MTARPSRSRHRSALVVRRNDDDHRHDVQHRDLTICWGRHQPSDRQSLQIAKLHFVGGPLRVSSSSASRSGSVAVVAMSRSPHGNPFRIVVGLIRFGTLFRCADRSSSSFLLSSEREEGCGACAKPRSDWFCTGSTPSSVARRSTNAAELIWPSVELESPNRFQSYL